MDRHLKLKDIIPYLDQNDVRLQVVVCDENEWEDFMEFWPDSSLLVPFYEWPVRCLAAEWQEDYAAIRVSIKRPEP